MVNKHDTYTHFDHQQNDLNEWMSESNAILNCTKMNYGVLHYEMQNACLTDKQNPYHK